MTLLNANIPKNASIVILTGAGISAESGIETFRAADGLWHNHKVEDVATPEAFARDPALVHDFYNMRRTGLLQPAIKPNAAHIALAELEQNWPGNVLVVTQNIDDLHERGGTRNLIHMHGELLKAFCQFCGDKTVIRTDLTTAMNCTACRKTGGVRPDIVWFGEMPYQMDEIFAAVSECDLFISIGTSGNVYPAAGFVAHAANSGAHTVELNLEPSMNSSSFDQSITGPATQIVPQFVKELI